MSTMQHTAGYGPTGEHEHQETVSHGAHPGARTYIVVGAVLTVITAIELWVYNVEALSSWLALILAVLSATKFMLVIGFFMHLKFDNPLFRFMFGFGLLVAASIVTALWLLFHQYPLPEKGPSPLDHQTTTTAPSPAGH